MKIEKAKHRSIGITLRTAMLSWMVTIITLLVFAAVIIPQQNQTFLENLESKAHGVAVSLREVAAGAAVNEDYSSVVEHCKEMLKGDAALVYLVITKNDGFSLINDRTGWRSAPGDSKQWRPDKRAVTSGISAAPGSRQRAFNYACPFDYSGIEWGWIHVGLSLDSYDQNVRDVYIRTGFLALLCIVVSLAASIAHATRLVKPILSLRATVQKVAQGDLSARAAITSGDELESLANSFNTMTDSLLQRDQILESVRFAAQQFLSTADWKTMINEVLAKLGKAAKVSRAYVFENGTDDDGHLMCSQRYDWVAPEVAPQIDNWLLQKTRWQADGLTQWASVLEQGWICVALARDLENSFGDMLRQQDIKSVVMVPIMVGDKWWGFLGLDECAYERQWTDAEKDSLQAAADMLGAAIQRHEAREALVEAVKAAEAASEAKSQFLANMSHEIRTPITGVMGILHLLQRTRLDPKQERYVSNALSSSETLLTVIGDVLDFSKIEAGRLELDNATFSVMDMMDVSVRLFAQKAESKGIELAYRIGYTVPREVEGDANRLRQILVNLVGNAMKFTERGEIGVQCELQNTQDGVATLRFEVRDTGCGIVPEQQGLIFQSFWQADNSMSRLHSGTGLGLAISRQLCEMMGGEIGVNSEVGKGSTFWFTVRLKCAASGDNSPVAQRRDLRTLRVLVVDDCPMAQELGREFVHMWKGSAETAGDAASALEKLRRAVREGRPFAVALLDWKMPGFNGFEVARLIKADSELQHTGLVLLSGFADVGDSAELAAAGFVATVPKPIRSSDLYDAIVIAANGTLDPEHMTVAVMPQPQPMPGSAGLPAQILLAEDNEINREVANEMISVMGCRCSAVCSGHEVVEAVRAGGVDLVLMDCQMPGMDGYEATHQIRRWEQEQSAAGNPRHIPVVALTAHAMTGDRDRCLEAGMDDYLTKPLDPRALARMLNKWLAPQTPLPEQLPKQVFLTTQRLKPVPPLDYAGLLGRCNGKKDLTDRIVRKFVEQAGLDVAEIIGLAANPSGAEKLSAVAHRLKGAAATVMAEGIRQMAAQLETLAREKNLADVPQLAIRLGDQFARLKASDIASSVG